jgi:hypothetical protein
MHYPSGNAWYFEQQLLGFHPAFLLLKRKDQASA